MLTLELPGLLRFPLQDSGVFGADLHAELPVDVLHSSPGVGYQVLVADADVLIAR